MSVFATLPEIPVSEDTMTWIRRHQMLGLSQRFVGMSFTWDGTWHGEWPSGHGHETDGMGKLHTVINDCPRCLMVEFPGVRISGNHHDGYDVTDGETESHFATRSALVCRLSAKGWAK